MLTPKENALRAIYGENPEYMPMTLECFQIAGYGTLPITEEPLVDGYDPFGVYWHVDFLGGVPDNRNFMFEDIGDWEKYVKIPDLDQIDFKAMAEEEEPTLDRNNKLITYYHACGPWERLASFMGFENASIALIEDPESASKFCEKITDYHIDLAKRVIDAWGIDVFVYFDDIATANGLFMSPDVWREIFKPQMQRVVDYVNSRGVIYEEHTCGKCESVIDDYVEMGVRMWQSAQIMNDLQGIMKKHRGKLCLEGGWDTSGRPGCPDVTEEEIRAEVRRNVEDYGKNGGNLIVLPMLVSEAGNAMITQQHPHLDAFFDEYMKVRSLL